MGSFLKGGKMGWQERIERHKAEQRQREGKAARLKREKALRIAKEKIPPLLEALEELRCQELLTQIRDEVWGLGEVSITPKLDKIDAKVNEIARGIPLYAEAVLEAQYPVFIEAGEDERSLGGWGDTYTVSYPDHIRIDEEFLIVKAFYAREGDRGKTEEILIKVALHHHCRDEYDEFRIDESDSISFNDPERQRKLEELLTKDCISRQRFGEVPYTKKKAWGEETVIEAIINRGFYPGIEFEYLLDIAKETRSKTSGGGFLKKLFRK